MDELELQEEISVTECAGLLGITRQAVLHAIGAGHIPARRVGHQHIIRRGDCLAYQPSEARKRRGKEEGNGG